MPMPSRPDVPCQLEFLPSICGHLCHLWTSADKAVVVRERLPEVGFRVFMDVRRSEDFSLGFPHVFTVLIGWE